MIYNTKVYHRTPSRHRGIKKTKFDLSLASGYVAPRKGYVWTRKSGGTVQELLKEFV
jgi:hypothetical protein